MRARPAVVLVGAAVVVIGVGAGVALVGSGGSDPDVVVVGDSLAEQSTDALRSVGDDAGLDVEVHAYGGSAMCDWDDELTSLAAEPPPALVLSFSGNAVTPCFNPDLVTLSPQEIADRYRTALDAVVGQFDPDTTAVWVVLPPPDRDPGLEAIAAAMRAMYLEAARASGGPQIINGGALLSPDGVYHDRLACEDWEEDDCDPDGSVAVRQADGIHLTPAGGERYARAILAAVAP